MPRRRPLMIVDGNHQNSRSAMLLLPLKASRQQVASALQTTQNLYGVSGSYNPVAQIVTIVTSPTSTDGAYHTGKAFWSMIGIKDPTIVNVEQLIM